MNGDDIVRMGLIMFDISIVMLSCSVLLINTLIKFSVRLKDTISHYKQATL